jgi:hypothetical protein
MDLVSDNNRRQSAENSIKLSPPRLVVGGSMEDLSPFGLSKLEITVVSGPNIPKKGILFLDHLYFGENM